MILSSLVFIRVSFREPRPVRLTTPRFIQPAPQGPQLAPPQNVFDSIGGLAVTPPRRFQLFLSHHEALIPHGANLRPVLVCHPAGRNPAPGTVDAHKHCAAASGSGT